MYPIPLRGYPPPCPFVCGAISKLGSRSKPKSLKKLSQGQAKIVENQVQAIKNHGKSDPGHPKGGQGAPPSKKTSKSWFAGSRLGGRFSHIFDPGFIFKGSGVNFGSFFDVLVWGLFFYRVWVGI